MVEWVVYSCLRASGCNLCGLRLRRSRRKGLRPRNAYEGGWSGGAHTLHLPECGSLAQGFLTARRGGLKPKVQAGRAMGRLEFGIGSGGEDALEFKVGAQRQY